MTGLFRKALRSARLDPARIATLTAPLPRATAFWRGPDVTA